MENKVSRRPRRKLAQTSLLAPLPKRRALIATPTGISKSMAKALGCETFFTGQYLQRAQSPGGDSELARTGTEFHAWRAAYVEHLIAINQWEDASFADRWLSEHAVSEETERLIQRDASCFKINPQAIYATELFLSVDRDFRPLEHILNRAPGLLSEHPDFYVCGQLDLVAIDGDEAVIVDPKSGWSTQSVTDDEPPIYAALLFSHFPRIKSVRFHWDFVRVKASRQTVYERRDMDWIRTRIHELNARKNAMIDRYNGGATLTANPTCGNCVYCALACPLRPRADAGEITLGPLQSEDDAILMAKRIKVCEIYLDRARPILRSYLDANLFGELDFEDDWAAILRTDKRAEYPLVDTLKTMGLGLVDIASLDPRTRRLVEEQAPSYTPHYDVPLHALAVSGLSGPMKTKKSRKRPDGGGVSREGMREALAPIANQKPCTVLTIRKRAAQIEDAEEEA